MHYVALHHWSNINEIWSIFVPLNTFNIPNNEGVNEWAGGKCHATRKCHEIKRISNLHHLKPF